jgi:hypothetical protein
MWDDMETTSFSTSAAARNNGEVALAAGSPGGQGSQAGERRDHRLKRSMARLLPQSMATWLLAFGWG